MARVPIRNIDPERIAVVSAQEVWLLGQSAMSVRLMEAVPAAEASDSSAKDDGLGIEPS